MSKNPHAVAMGKKGGSVTSERKTAAARKNGKKGGRPQMTYRLTDDDLAALIDLLDRTEFIQDEGPSGEGWTSDEHQIVWQRVREIAEKAKVLALRQQIAPTAKR